MLLAGSINNQIFILSKSYNEYADTLCKLINNSIVIYDSDYSIGSDVNLWCCLTEMVKKNSAWDRTMHYISNNYNLLDTYDYFYFIEDDVYSNDISTFNKLINLLNNYNHDLISNDIVFKNESSHWHWWHKYKHHQIKSFNPLCRISKKLLQLIIQYYYDHKKFIFHEVLFASLAKDNDLNILDFKDIKEYSNIFGKFTYRPTISKNSISDNKIYHPVKPIYENI